MFSQLTVFCRLLGSIFCAIAATCCNIASAAIAFIFFACGEGGFGTEPRKNADAAEASKKSFMIFFLFLIEIWIIIKVWVEIVEIYIFTKRAPKWG